MEILLQNYRSLLAETSVSFIRYLYDRISWDARFIAIVGGRGVGKTTMMLQHILLTHTEKESLYISANDSYFTAHTLYEIAETFYKDGGKYLYIDEIHKYSGNWSNEVKEMYDYLKQLQVVISGSCMLEITGKIDADLSRRVVPFTLEGLSFREYLNFTLGLNIPSYSLEDILSGKVSLPPEIRHPLPLFKEYLAKGYFPFFKEPLYYQRLSGVITATLEQDIPQYARLSPATVHKLKQLLFIVAGSVPFKPNYSDLGRTIGTDRKNVPSYLLYMQKSGLIRMLCPEGEGMKYMEKAEKIYLNNTNFAYALTAENSNVGNIRETVFLSSMSANYDVRASEYSDFYIKPYTFEIGGKSKGSQQVSGLQNAFIVKDDIEFAYKNNIPLWMFGMNY